MQGQRVLGGNRRPFMCLYLSEMPDSIRNTLGNWINNWIGLAWLGFCLGFLLGVFFFFFLFVCVCFLYFGWLSPFGEDVAVLWLHSLWVLFTKRHDMIKHQINVNVSALGISRTCLVVHATHKYICMFIYIYSYSVVFYEKLVSLHSTSRNNFREISSISLRSQIIRQCVWVCVSVTYPHGMLRNWVHDKRNNNIKNRRREGEDKW